MKIRKAGKHRTLVLSLLLSLSLSPAFANIQTTTETTFTYGNASGPGAANSYLNQGWRYSTGITLSEQNQTEQNTVTPLIENKVQLHMSDKYIISDKVLTRLQSERSRVCYC